MKIQPLGPDAIRERMAEIRQRLGKTNETSFGDRLNTEVLRTSGYSTASLGPMNAVPTGANELGFIADQIADKQGLDKNLFRSLIQAESSWNPQATSTAGAMGLTQLMPGTAESLGIANPYDPVQNMEGGAKYLKQMLEQFGDVRLALAAYNAGPGAVMRHNGVPPYRETQDYVKRVLSGVDR